MPASSRSSVTCAARRPQPRRRRGALLPRLRRLSPPHSGSVDHLIQRGEFLTSYTPYQPEIAQGTLQALFEFQTQVARLYGCDVANASMYDGSTACWEAIAMARRITRRGKAILSSGLHPALRLGGADDGALHRRRARQRLPELVAGDRRRAADRHAIDGETSSVVVQYPDILGRIGDLGELADRATSRALC